MKIKSITLQNYKQFVEPITFSFTNPDGEVNEKTLLIGNNGTGKSSILQAIVALVASAVRENFTPESLDWAGYEYRFLQTGNLPLRIEIEILLSEEEIDFTKQYFKQLKEKGINLGRMPSDKKTVILYLDYNNKKVLAKEGLAAFNQLTGYQYAKNLAQYTPNKALLFENVGNIYWYNEQRNLSNFSYFLEDELPQIDFIRSFLASAYYFHQDIETGKRTLKEGEFDFYNKFQSLYASIFPDRKLVGATPRFDIYEKSKVPNFYLSVGKNQYEISGMSAGERAVFPILMDLARWTPNNSIFIIDESELHLHPPLQQAFVRTLLNVGKNNQFIFTTHSNSVSSMFSTSENEIIRLK
jgi:predicted ATP-dependent endonuclease of OLD family